MKLRKLFVVGLACALSLLFAGVAVADAEAAKVLVFSGTTGYRHEGGSTANDRQAIDGPVISLMRSKLSAAGIETDYRTCNGMTTALNNGALVSGSSPTTGTPAGCRNPDVGVPSIFTAANLEQYDAIFLFQASSTPRGQSTVTNYLWNEQERAVVQAFVQNGGGIAAQHATAAFGAGQTAWSWFDADGGDSLIGTGMPGHGPTNITNVAAVEVSDNQHPSTQGLPDFFLHGDEHYTWGTNVRGKKHVLATLDTSNRRPGTSYTLNPVPGGHNPADMGADHPISWCANYQGGRTWITGLGHFAQAYLDTGGQTSNLMKHVVGGVAWAAGVEGNDSDCAGTVWNNFQKTNLASNLQGPIGLDIAEDGKVYWSEIGRQHIDFETPAAQPRGSRGSLKVWDPDNNQVSTVVTIPTRTEYASSNDGVLGMALDPDFTTNRFVYVYYSPRTPSIPGQCGGAPNCINDSSIYAGYNVISRFTLTADGKAVVAGSEQEILRIDDTKIGNNNADGIQQAQSAHSGAAGIAFDSDGNLYVGTGDDVDHSKSGGMAPIDGRYAERYDARNTSANSADLRGKILRVKPRPNASGTPGPGQTYDIPAGNMFPQGTPQTKPEIYAMGFRNPYSLHVDPENPGVVVVGEYGPDASADSSRGPAGITEWNLVTEPGFYGWPLCTGNNSVANTYPTYDYAAGTVGAKFDCSASSIPVTIHANATNQGLPNIPGPAKQATLWHKRGGADTHPSWMNLPATTAGGHESLTGPIYRYDPSTASSGRWPAYFDGSWLVFNRGDNWWREAKLTRDADNLLTVNGFFQPTASLPGGATNTSYIMNSRFGPDGALYTVKWNHGCCRDGLGANPGHVLQKIEFTANDCISDEEDPVVTPAVGGTPVGGGSYSGQATLTLTATDFGCGGVDTIQYSTTGPAGTWQNYNSANKPVFGPGSHTVHFRATDNFGNTSAPGSIPITVIAAETCTFAFSDEFDGTGAYDPVKWPYRWGGSATPPGVPSLVGGSLNLPQGSFSTDLDRTGPIAFIGRTLPAGDWSIVAKVTNAGMGNDAGGLSPFYSQVGLKLYQSDANWIKMVHTRAAAVADPANNTYFEMPYETNNNRDTGTRHGQGEDPGTVWVRLTRTGNTISGAFATSDPFTGGSWSDIGHTVNINTVLPGAEPIYIGPYGGNGSLTAQFDYVRLVGETPTSCPDTTPPVVTASLDPASGPYVEPTVVTLTLNATDDDSGVDTVEYDTGSGWQAYNAAAKPQFSTAAGYSITYRATDVAGNTSTVGTIEFEIEADSTPPPPASLKISGKKKVAFKGKKAGKVKLTVANNGGSDATGVKLCVKAPKKKVKTKSCINLGTITPGASKSKSLSFKAAKKFVGKKYSANAKVTVTAKSGDATVTAKYDVKLNKKV